MKVQDIMTRDVVTCPRDSTVRDVAKRMTEKNVGSVIITENRRCVGIVTDHDVVVHAIGKGENPDEFPVQNVMHENPVTCKQDETVWDVAHRTIETKGPFRRVPVLNDSEEVVGVLSVADLALVAHPLMEAILNETQASVSEAKVEELGIKSHLREISPSPRG